MRSALCASLSVAGRALKCALFGALLQGSLLPAPCSFAATRYVRPSGSSSTSPYTSWSTAATNIQLAVDVATNGDLIVVTNGTYATGGRPRAGYATTNRVTIEKAITVRSVNGPTGTVIVGASPNAGNAVRCVYLGANAFLAGFTLTNGATRVSGDATADQSGGGAWCQTNGIVSNCILVANTCAYYGGGAYGGVLYDCTVATNSGGYGGGACGGVLYNCTLQDNAAGYGGGTYSGALHRCTLLRNTANEGAGVSRSTLYSCLVFGNATPSYAPSGNYGGGSFFSTLVNCTVVSNSAYTYSGGGMYDGTATNCIVYFNTAGTGADVLNTTLAYSCSPAATNGPGNVTNDPRFVSLAATNLRPQITSPCVNKGTNMTWMTGATDLGGNPRINDTRVDMGAYEQTNIVAAVTGTVMTVPSIAFSGIVFAATAAYLPANATAPVSLQWKPVPLSGQGTTQAQYRFDVCGSTNVSFVASNVFGSAASTQAVLVQSVVQTVYVRTNGSDLAEGTNWVTARATLQAGVDRVAAGGTVWVSNGVYAAGGRPANGALTNRVAIDKAITVRSVNGPAVTLIRGAGPNGDAAVRCVYLGANAVLAGFTLTNGATLTSGDIYTDQSGGGVWGDSGAIVSNGVLAGNSCGFFGGGAYGGGLYNCDIRGNSASSGGGASYGALYNCTLFGNTASSGGGGALDSTLFGCLLYGNNASFEGGGAMGSTLVNCSVVSNSVTSYSGGGIRFGTATNCIVYFNVAGGDASDVQDAQIVFSCSPNATDNGNIPDDPQFVSVAATDFRLQLNSPCLNAGTNMPWMTGAADLDGAPRLQDGRVEMGAYEQPLPATVFVSPTGNDGRLGTNWLTAKATIQAGIDAVAVGGTVWVSNGVYAIGGRPVYGDMMNRVAIDKAIAVRSVNGPSVTAIKGFGPAGYESVRCVYLGSNAFLGGFTLSSGATRAAGDPAREQSGGGLWAESTAVASNCVLTGNTGALNGGGAYGAGALHNCTIRENSAYTGGGASGGGLYNCAIARNTATGDGGGAHNAVLRNCTVAYNSALRGGGVSGCASHNSIVYHNTASEEAPNGYLGSADYSCTTPNPGGVGNIVADPGLADDAHLSAYSSCIGKGLAAYATGVDIDGESWTNPPSIGCDEYKKGNVAGPLTVNIVASATNVAVGCPLSFSAVVAGSTTGNRWTFGDGSSVLNAPSVSHIWTSPGLYAVTLTAYNTSWPRGVTAVVWVNVVGSQILYVNAANPAPAAPYATWETAATTIQDAIDAATVPGALILVTNGVYAGGGRPAGNAGTPNVVTLDRAVTVRSVNGSAATVIRGSDSPRTRCAYVGAGASLDGFTLTNGNIRTGSGIASLENGGGVWAEPGGSVSNCVITGNGGGSGGGACYGAFYYCLFAGNQADHGGAAYQSVLNNCILSGNAAISNGGATAFGTLNNCLLAGNAAGLRGGGAYGGALNNCTVVSNVAANAGGGVAQNSALRNSIVYDNLAPLGANYYAAAAMTNSCTTPSPDGARNLTSPPKFVNVSAGDYRLAADSPCIDKGFTERAMLNARDLDGRPRLIRGAVDMGAYEFHFDVRLKVLLQGAYRTNRAGMIAGNTVLPPAAPYAFDRRTGVGGNATVTDWILVQVRPSPNGLPICSRSAYVRGDGVVTDAAGNTNLLLEVAPGTSNYLVVAHRNHLAVMSASSVPFTNQTIAFDFSRTPEFLYGGTNGCVPLNGGGWGMIAADADGDGEILAADQAIWQSQHGYPGYHRADFDLDGMVTTNDLALWSANAYRTSAVPNPQTLLTPALAVTPVRKTVPSGTNVLVTLGGGVVGTGNWTFVKSVSGSLLTPLTPTSAVYQAGATQGTDVVEAWDATGKLARAFFNVLDDAAVAGIGRAVVIAGREDEEDPLWSTTDYLADLGYNTLLYRGFVKENLLYLSPEPDQDADGNGYLDDIAGESTLANVTDVFTNWANAPGPLFLYLVDHGGSSSGNGYFRLNADETLSAAELDGWLDRLQDSYTNDVTVVLDCCQAGSFLPALTYTGPARRTVIAACGTNEATYFVAGGMVSFSQAFFSGILMGQDLRDTFVAAQAAMTTYQYACMDGDKNGAYTTNDELSVTNIYVGPTFLAGGNLPQINEVLGQQTLDEASSVTLWAYDISTPYPPITRVWCLIVPPGHTTNPSEPVRDLKEVDLAYGADTGRYEADYGGFTQTGLYTVVYYAKDSAGGISPPRQSQVWQAGYDERAILVAAGTTSDALWPAVSNLSSLAYRTFRGRWFNTNSICFLSPAAGQDADSDGIPDVWGPPTLTNLAFAVSNWAGSANWGGPADKLTVYLIGDGTNGLFRLNGEETLDADTLDAWLDDYQVSNRQVCVVMDFPGAGGFIPPLTAFPTQTQQRVCIAGAKSNQTARMEGSISFSQFFLTAAFSGQDIGCAFSQARLAIRNATGTLRQRAQMDDNGDGTPDKFDGALAQQWHIGPGFVTGTEKPVIGSVMPDVELDGAGAVTLWVADVTAANGLSNVVCTLTPPDYDGEAPLRTIDLTWNPTNRHYETILASDVFTVAGLYICTFQAADNAGTPSVPVQALVGTIVADAYEPDNSAAQARGFRIGTPQTHNFHCSNDTDWVRFYVPGGMVCAIEAEPLYGNVDLWLRVWRQCADGTLAHVDSVDDEGLETTEETVWLDLKADPTLPPGFYYVQASPTNAWQAVGTDYELRIFDAEGGGGIYVAAVDVVHTGVPLADAVAVFNGVVTQAFGTAMDFFTNAPPGTYQIHVPVPPGYVPLWDLELPGQETNPASYWFGNPKNVTTTQGCEVAIFQFMPVIQANGAVLDSMTGKGVAGAHLAFTARSGTMSNCVFDGFPGLACYRTNWLTGPDGAFPTNVWLPAVNWDLTISRPGYPDVTTNGLLVDVPRGMQTNAGSFGLAPNLTTNGVPEWWLFDHGWTNDFFAAATNDADGDGQPTWCEWVSDTDPTNRASALRLLSLTTGAGGVRVAWQGGADATQYLERSRALAGTNLQWLAAFTNIPPTLTATNILDAGGTNAPLFYRVKAER